MKALNGILTIAVATIVIAAALHINKNGIPKDRIPKSIRELIPKISQTSSGMRIVAENAKTSSPETEFKRSENSLSLKILGASSKTLFCYEYKASAKSNEGDCSYIENFRPLSGIWVQADGAWALKEDLKNSKLLRQRAYYRFFAINPSQEKPVSSSWIQVF